MKKNKKIFLICILFILVILFFIIFCALKKDDSAKLTAVDSIVVQKFVEVDGNFEEKKITNNEEIDKIVNIIENRTKMLEEEIVPYKKIPHYRLILLDKNNLVIEKINFFYYSNDSSWISFYDDDSSYIIDSNSLLKILNY